MISQIKINRKQRSGVNKIEDESDIRLFNEVVQILNNEEKSFKRTKSGTLNAMFHTKSL